MTDGQATPRQDAPADGPESFATRFAEAYSRLWMLATALLRDRTEAEDLVQEAALVGLKKFEQFEPGTNFGAWMAQIVRFQASNWRSKRTRRKTEATDPVDLDRGHSGASLGVTPDVAESAAGGLGQMAEGFDEEVVAALETIAAIPRACLLLKIVHELSYDVIGEMLGIPDGTAMSHVHRSRVKLRNHLNNSKNDLSTNA